MLAALTRISSSSLGGMLPATDVAEFARQNSANVRTPLARHPCLSPSIADVDSVMPPARETVANSAGVGVVSDLANTSFSDLAELRLPILSVLIWVGLRVLG